MLFSTCIFQKISINLHSIIIENKFQWGESNKFTQSKMCKINLHIVKCVSKIIIYSLNLHTSNFENVYSVPLIYSIFKLKLLYVFICVCACVYIWISVCQSIHVVRGQLGVVGSSYLGRELRLTSFAVCVFTH